MNKYDWRPWWAWHPCAASWLLWVERRWRGGVAPNGDLASGAWEYRKLKGDMK